MLGRFIGSSFMCIVPAFLVAAIVAGLIGGQRVMFDPAVEEMTEEEIGELTPKEMLELTFTPPPPATAKYRIAFSAAFAIAFAGGVFYLMRETRPRDRRVGPTGDVVTVVHPPSLRA
ncbi:MAG: hypothetical protein ABGY41_16790 [Candidatus Poribacteria bacterium]